MDTNYSNNARVELHRESRDLEERMVPIVAEMNAFPLVVSYAAWVQNFEKANRIVENLVEYCRYLSGSEDFRPNSRADVKKALGCEATDKDSLQSLAVQGSDLAETVLIARSAISCLSQLRKWEAVARLGTVQPLWNSLGCPHGRFTSETPCLTNRIPSIRETIQPEPGFTFLGTDYSQCEYSVWASLSHDTALSEIFLAGRDLHVEMATLISSLIPDWDPGEDLRQAGKTLNFSILYRMRPHTMSIKLGCSLATAKKIMKIYFSKARVGMKYIHHVLNQARELGWVETHYGRRRYCFDYQSSTGDREIHEQEKTIWSHHNAGSAAELVKWRMVETWGTLRGAGFTADHVRLSINLFDGLVWSIRTDLLAEIKPIITSIWNETTPGFLPMRSTITTGGDWNCL